jgi:hypothetical protein
VEKILPQLVSGVGAATSGQSCSCRARLRRGRGVAAGQSGPGLAVLSRMWVTRELIWHLAITA